MVDLDYSKSRQAVERIFNETRLRPRIEENSRGVSFTVRRSGLELKVIVGNKWLGYSLVLDSGSHGKSLEISEDTDNYPIDGDYADVAAEILKDVVAGIKAFAAGKILAGRRGGKTYLAAPLGDGRYKLAVKGLFFTSLKGVDSSRLKDMTFMHDV